MLRASPVLACLVACSVAHAELPTIPLSAAHVATLSLEDIDVRVAVYSQGFDHITSRVTVEWIKRTAEGPRLVASAEISEIGMLSVGEPKLLPRPDGPLLYISGVGSTYPGYWASYIVALPEPGKYEILDRRTHEPAV